MVFEKVVILCGGLGTRLKEETEFKPKPMVEIGGRPILWHIMKMYSSFGFNDFVLCLGYKGNVIRDYFYNYRAQNTDFTVNLRNNDEIVFHNDACVEDWKVTLVNTGEKNLKGSRIKQIEKHIGGNPFLLTYGDGVAKINIHKLLDFHVNHGLVGTMTGVSPPSRFGVVDSNRGVVTSFFEKPQAAGGVINGGFFVFENEFFDYLSPDPTCEFESGALGRLVDEANLALYPLKSDWACMDTLRDVEYLNELWRQDKAFWKMWRD